MKKLCLGMFGFVLASMSSAFAAGPCDGTYRIGMGDGELRHLELHVVDVRENGLASVWHLHQYDGSREYTYGEFEIVPVRCYPDSEFFIEFDVTFWASYRKFFSEIPATSGGTCYDQVEYECGPAPGVPAHWGEAIERRPYRCRMNASGVECSPLNAGDNPGRLVLSVR